jgi:hypothetical protein
MAARPGGVELVPPVGDRDRVRGSWDAPVTLVEFDSSTEMRAIHGELDGVFWMDSVTIVAENRLKDGVSRYTAFNSGVQSEPWTRWALRED